MLAQTRHTLEINLVWRMLGSFEEEKSDLNWAFDDCQTLQGGIESRKIAIFYSMLLECGVYTLKDINCDLFFFATLIDQPEAKLWRKIILCSFVCLTWAILISFFCLRLWRLVDVDQQQFICAFVQSAVHTRVRMQEAQAKRLFFDDGEEFGIVEVLIEWILQLFEISVGSFTTYIIKKYVYWKETGLLLWLALEEERERKK